MVGDLIQGSNEDYTDIPTKETIAKRKKKPAVTVEDEIDQDYIVAPVGDSLPELGPDDPILVGINEWLLYRNLVDEVQKDYEEWRQEFTPENLKAEGYEKALMAWEARSEERTSKWSPYRRKKRW